MSFQELLNHIYQGQSIDFQKCESLSLALNKLIKSDIIERGGRLKKDFLNGFKKLPTTIRNLKEQTDKIKSSLKNQGYKEVICKPFTTKSRLVVGLGSSHVLETALTLHHIYGIPYIPSSALKGVCRAVAFWKIAEKKGILHNEGELKRLSENFYGKLTDDKEILPYQLLFGAQDFKGLLLFLDAYPEINSNDDIFELDIMNVHYKSYYEGKTSPGDWENPTPIYFLTVKPGVEFHICVLFDEWRWEQIKDKEPFSKVDVKNTINSELEDIIKTALKEFGVGAKGRLGYGVLE